MHLHKNRSHERLLTLLITLGMIATSIMPALAQTPVATPIASPVIAAPYFEEAKCMYELPSGLTEEDVVCGWVTAPMYPDGSQNGTVKLPIIRVLAVTDAPAPEPLMILLGGPGQNMSAVLPAFGNETPLWDFMLDRQDVILFDQRGMGKSSPTLACPFERTTEGGEAVSDSAVGFSLLRCGSTLKVEGIDPAAFTTQNNAADIDAIRIAMGYDQVDVYGISYGSKLALSAIRDYPDSIRSTIIASPLPLEANPFADQTLGFDQSLKLVWEACAADEQCAAQNPDPAGDFQRAVDRLKTEPMTIIAIDQENGESIELKVDDIQFMQILYLSVFVGPLIPIVPSLVTSVANGDDAILQMVGPSFLMDGGLSLGALFTYFCQDEVPFSSSRDTKAEIAAVDLPAPFTEGSWISLGDQSYSICRGWKFPDADNIENKPVTSDIPLLIFTGTFDPITPSGNGELVATNFPNSQWINFTAQGHDPASYVPECSGPMILGFLDNPMATVDADCATEEIDFSMSDFDTPPDATPLAATAGNLD